MMAINVWYKIIPLKYIHLAAILASAEWGKTHITKGLTRRCFKLIVRLKSHTLSVRTGFESVPTAWPLRQHVMISIRMCSMNTIRTYDIRHVGIVM